MSYIVDVLLVSVLPIWDILVHCLFISFRSQLTADIHDLGVPVQKSGSTAQVIITVTRDMYAPKFAAPLYTKNITEGAQVNDIIVQVSASDRDTVVSDICLTNHIID